jgi:hypothetical protein
MNDRELLEQAAKAAGIAPLDFDYAQREGHGCYLGPRLPMREGVFMAAMWVHWDPLVDDGDALRLAAALKIDIEWQSTGIGAEPAVEAYRSEIDTASYCAAEHERDYRRAIVRAAAEIGKQLGQDNQPG